MKKSQVFACQSCFSITSSTSEKIIRSGLCIKCRQKKVMERISDKKIQRDISKILGW